MEKTRFAIISDLFKLSRCISDSLKLAESLIIGTSDSPAKQNDIRKGIKREMKTVPVLLERLCPAARRGETVVRLVLRRSNGTG